MPCMGLRSAREESMYLVTRSTAAAGPGVRGSKKRSTAGPGEKRKKQNQLLGGIREGKTTRSVTLPKERKRERLKAHTSRRKKEAASRCNKSDPGQP